MSLFGLEFKSREERERDERDYLYRIFPGGNEQKKAVEKELASKLPWVVKVSKRQRMIKVTPEILKVVREVLDENG